MKLVSESLSSFQRGRDPLTSMGLGVEAAIQRIKESIKWRIEDDRWKGPGTLKFDAFILSEISDSANEVEEIAIKKILEEFLSGKKKWRDDYIGFPRMHRMLEKYGLIWDPKYMWPCPNNADSVRNVSPEKFQEFASKYWKPNQLYSAGVKHEWAALMKMGLAAGATNLEIGGTDPFIIAASYGDAELMKMLLDKCPNDPSGGTKDDKRYNRDSDKDMTNAPLRIAARKGHIDVVKLLMKDPRVDPSAGNNFALNWSFYEGHKDMAILLLTDKRVRDKVDLIPKTRRDSLRSAGLIESQIFKRGEEPKAAMGIGTKYEGLKVYRCGSCGAFTDPHGYPILADDPEYDRVIDIIEKFGDKTTNNTFCDECRYAEEMEAQQQEDRIRQEEEARWEWEREQEENDSMYR
jgi:hypothetical protein